MSSRADSAVPTRLSSIRNELIGKKLRVVGKILSHDVRSSSVFLWNDNHIVLVDISLCLPTSGSIPWLRESLCTVTLFGYLERSQADVHLPDLPEQLPHKDLVLIPHFSLQAILVLDSPDVDLRLWNETVAEMEASGLGPEKKIATEFPMARRPASISVVLAWYHRPTLTGADELSVHD